MTTGYQSLWQPPVWISYMADAEAGKWMVWLFDTDVGQGDPALYHTANILWHVIDVVLLFLVLNVLTKKAVAKRVCCRSLCNTPPAR